MKYRTMWNIFAKFMKILERIQLYKKLCFKTNETIQKISFRHKMEDTINNDISVNHLFRYV